MTHIPSSLSQVKLTLIHLISSMIAPLLIIMMVVPIKPSELTILDTPNGGTGPAPCAITCSGIGRWDATGDYSWKGSYSYRHPFKATKNVDMSGCNFVSPPVVTVTIRSPVSGMCPSVTVIEIYGNVFSLYSVEGTTAAHMTSKKCDIHWIAAGYNC